MSSAHAATDPPLKRRLRSWTSAAAADDDGGDGSTAAATPPAASASSASSSDTAPPKRKKARRQQLLAAAFDHQPQPPRWHDLSPAQRCFSDGLALIFSFLSLFELIPAACACRSWRQAAIKANVAGAEVENPLIWPDTGDRSSSRLQSLVSSPFRRHVHALTRSDVVISPAIRSAHPLWSLSDLQLLQQLSQLRRISGIRIELYSLCTELSMMETPPQLTFPRLLESVDLHLSSDSAFLDDDDEGDWSIQSVQGVLLRALRPCHSLRELSITMHPYSRLNVEPLLKLANLQTLTLDISKACAEGSECRFDEEQIRAVAKLSSLHRLTLRECNGWEDFDEDDPFGARWLRWLCSLPHRLDQLEELDLSQMSLHLEHMQLLQRLPALTALEPVRMCDSSIPLLQAFAARLQRLKLSFDLWEDEQEIDPQMVDETTGFARGPLLLPRLTPCTALTQLTLSSCVFDEAETVTLCQALSRLRELDLIDVGWPSLEPLRHLPQLESLSMHQHVGSLPQSLLLDAAHVAPLTQLRCLTLANVLEQPLTSAASALITALRPPSALLPGLVEFHFSS